MGVPLGDGGVLSVGMYWLVPNWWVQSGAGSVSARTLHYQSTTQQWYCIAATLLRCICHPHRYVYTQMATTGLGVLSLLLDVCICIWYT